MPRILHQPKISLSLHQTIDWAYSGFGLIQIYEKIAATLHCCNDHTYIWGECRGGVNKACMLNKPAYDMMKKAWDWQQMGVHAFRIVLEKPNLLIEPYQPTWNTAVLERMPYDLMINGEIHDKPFYIDAVFRWVQTSVPVSAYRLHNFFGHTGLILKLRDVKICSSFFFFENY